MKSRTWLRRATAAALGILAFPALLEAALWALHFGFRPEGRADLDLLAPRAGERRILCVGDSNTFGIHLEPCASYPGRLQRYLDLAPENPWRVVNLGYPGQNTAQIRARLAQNLRAYKPEVVIVWAGANNTWSPAMRHLWELPDRETDARTSESIVQQLRVYKLARMLAHRLRGAPFAGAPPKTGQGAIPGLDGAARGEGLGEVETAHVEDGVRFSDEEVARSIEIDLARIHEICDQHGARLVLADYPWVTVALERAVNPTIAKVAAARRLPFAQLSATVRGDVERFGARRTMFSDLHATALFNREIARRFLIVLMEHGLVEDRPEWRGLPALDDIVDRVLFEVVETDGTRVTAEIQGGDHARFEIVPAAAPDAGGAQGAPIAAGTLDGRGWALVGFDLAPAGASESLAARRRLCARTFEPGSEAAAARSGVIEVRAGRSTADAETAATRR